MTQLLVSVRSASEALAALDGGADWIDVKEPSRGALGAADITTMASVVLAVANRCPVSAALGELDSQTVDRVRRLPHVLRLVKVGLAGCGTGRDWRDSWSHVAAALPGNIRLAAVVYADWQAVGAPRPRDVLAAAISLGCPTLLIDTFRKHGSTLFDCWPIHELTGFVSDVRHAGLRLALAGALSLPSLDAALRLTPDWVAVRGAACRAGRDGVVEVARVRELADKIAQVTPVVT